MRYGFGCDHAGFDLKEVLVKELVAAGHEVVDMGTNSTERTDFPLYANKVAEGVSEGTLDMGVLVCGTGLGMALAAGRYPGVRAVSLSDCFSARMARAHNDANVLCVGARVLGAGAAAEVLKTWLATEFEGGRYSERLELMRGGYKRLLKNDASPRECVGYAREKDAGSANSSAICTTEDVLSRRPVRSGGLGFVLQRPDQGVFRN